MKCPSCGYQTQPGAKFCVQCGTTLAAASAPVAPAVRETTTVRPAAPSPPPVQPAPVQSAPTSSPRPSITPPVPPAGASNAQPVAPAVAAAPSSPRRLGLVAGVAVALIVMVVGGYIGYKALFGEEATEPTGRVEPPKAGPSMPGQSATPTPAQEGSVPSQPSPPAASDQAKAETTGPATAAPPAAVPAPATATTTTITPGPSPRSDAVPQARTATPPSPQGAQPKAPPTPASPATAQAGAQRPPAAQPDRWEQMHQAMLRCAREEFMTRFVCEQRVGRQYCEGYWGTVPQCPGTQRERGQ